MTKYKVKFMVLGDKGKAVYNTDTGEYSWSYEGTEDWVTDSLSVLDNGKAFTDIDTTVINKNDDNEFLEVGEREYFPSWKYQMEELALLLERQPTTDVMTSF